MTSLYLKSIVLKICKSSFINVCKYVRHYPIVSAISFLPALLYIFIPSVVVFFIYLSPIFILAAATRCYRSRSKAQDAKRNGIKQEKKIEKKLSTLGKSKSVANDRPTVTKPTRSMSQRRNKEKFFVEADPIIAHDVKASISDFLREVRNKRDEESETTKGKHDQEGGGSCFLTKNRDPNPKLETDPPLVNDQRGDNDGGGEDSGSSEDDKAAVEWNEDDQKNLMDLGISEMERNKRLESLIARRRSRKFYKMNSEKGMTVDIDLVGPCSSPSVAMSEIVSPVLISTSRIDAHLLLHDSSRDDQFPGSAPSILLPGKNPFDLPYDPHEEKPDLMADSFQQEFSITPHKEMCRHESFSLGHTTRTKILSGTINEQKPPRLSDPIARTVSITDLVVTDLLEPRQPYDSGPGEIIEFISDHSVRRDEKNIPKDANDQGSEISPNPRPPSLPRPIPKAASANDLSNEASLSIIHNMRVDEHYQNRGTWHTPTNSVASDLQVEVSEVGSPTSTVSDVDDDRDRGSLTYDGDIEKEFNSGNEELWGLSPHAPRIGKHELALRFLNEASEEGMREARFADNVQDFGAEIISNIKPLEKEEEVVAELITRHSKNHLISDLQESKEISDPLQVDVEEETKKNNDMMDGDIEKINNTEELKSIERQTIYEIGDDRSKTVETIVTEPSSHFERELLQGPENLADVIVKRSEQIDSALSSTSNLVGGVLEPLHHIDIGIRDDKVVPTLPNEASRFAEDVKESGGGNMRDGNVQQILTPSETQSTNSVVNDRVIVTSPSYMSQTLSSLQPEVAIDQDLTDLNSTLSLVSVLMDMNQGEAQTTLSPINQQVHDMEESAYHVDQTPMNHNEQHQPLESSNGEINSRESLSRVDDQDRNEMEFTPQHWNGEDHNVHGKEKNLTETLLNGDPIVKRETHVKEEVPKSFEDVTCSPNPYGHFEGATSSSSKSEDNQYHVNLEEKENERLIEEAIGERNNNDNVVDEGNEVKSLSITKEAIAEPEILHNMSARSDDLKMESLSTLKQELIMELPNPSNLVPSNDLQGDVIESIRQDAAAGIVKPSDLKQTLEGESLSSIRREAMAESLKEVDMISRKSLLDGNESMSSIKEPITSMEQSKAVVDLVPLMAAGDYSLASVQLKALEPLKTDDLMPSLSHGDESLSSIKQGVAVEVHVPADSMSSIESVKVAPIQTEVVHIETSKPIVEDETPSLSKKISPEKVQPADMEIEHNVAPVKIAKDKINVDHNHFEDEMDNNQNSKVIEDDEEDEGAFPTANRQNDHLVTKSGQQVDHHESKRTIENKNNDTMIVPPLQPGDERSDHHNFEDKE